MSPIAKLLNFAFVSIMCAAAILAFYFSDRQYNWVGIAGVCATFCWFYFSAFKICNLYMHDNKILIEILGKNELHKEISSIKCIEYTFLSYKIIFNDNSSFYFYLKPKTYLSQIINSENLTDAFIRIVNDIAKK